MLRIFKWLIGLAVLGFAGLLVLVAVTYYSIIPSLPDVSELKKIEWQMPLTVYTKDLKLIAEFGELDKILRRITKK